MTTIGKLLCLGIILATLSGCQENAIPTELDEGRWNPNTRPFVESVQETEDGSAVVQRGDEVIFLGGGQPQRIKKVKSFNLLTQEWSTLPPMRISRYDAAALNFDNYIVVAGGSGNSWEEIVPTKRTLERFDVATGTWSLLPPMLDPRFNGSNFQFFAACRDRIYTVSTSFSSGRTTIYESSDINNPIEGFSWKTIETTLPSASFPSLVTVGESIYIISGESVIPDYSGDQKFFVEFDTRSRELREHALPPSQLPGLYTSIFSFQDVIYRLVDPIESVESHFEIFDTKSGVWETLDETLSLWGGGLHNIILDSSEGHFYLFSPPSLPLGFHFNCTSRRAFIQ